MERYDGQAAKLVAAADGSAAKLVDLVVDSFPGFRDAAPYRCRASHGTLDERSPHLQEP